MDKFYLYKDVCVGVSVALEVSCDVFHKYIDSVTMYTGIRKNEVYIDGRHSTQYYFYDDKLKNGHDSIGFIEHVDEPDFPPYLDPNEPDWPPLDFI